MWNFQGKWRQNGRKNQVGALFREYRRPRVEATDALPPEFLWAQVLEHHVQLGQRIDDHRTRQERSPEVPTRAALDVADGEQEIHRPLRAPRVAGKTVFE